ncbi:MAG: hypothetical protein Q8R47_03635 [Nanoarchaeota archaeon]|nr:hypothetical protein [Nanoarchaeota archaeon]
MFQKEALYGWYILIILVTGFMLINPLSSPTGKAVYTETNAEKVWDFTNASDYVYDSSILIDGTVQLKPLTITNTTIIQEITESTLLLATQYEDEDDDEGKNVTIKLQSLEQGAVHIKDSRSVVEIKLDHQLQTDDLLSVYLLSGAANGKVYLCENKDGCNLSAYGDLTLPGDVSAAWYNLTLSSMNGSNNIFFITSPDNIKMDMVKGYKKSSKNETTTSTSYSSSASVQTADLQPADWKRWETFSKVEQLHGQQVQYEYSTDSGSFWNLVPANGNFNSIMENKVRFRITLFSNSSTTPVVDSIKITYATKPACVENWIAQYGTCLMNDSRLKSYLDTNGCGTTATLPSDNGTAVICDYCALFNCSYSVIEESLAEVRGNETVYVVDAVAKANTKLELEAVNSTRVEIIGYDHNIKNETPSSKPLDRYVSIESSGPVSSVTISLYYRDAELIKTNIDENTLKIQYYNETSRQWEVLSSTVNLTENYVSTTMPHMSFYGLFGEQQSSADSSASSALVSGVSGGGTKSQEANLKKSTPTVSETALPIQSQLDLLIEPAPASESSCDYVVEMTLPDVVVMKLHEPYQGEIVNKGTCKIAKLRLELSAELQPMIDLSVLDSLSLLPGNKTNFILIRKKESYNDLFSTTSYAISSLKADSTLTGYIIVEGHDDQEKIFRKELPLSIVIKNAPHWKELVMAGLIMAVLSLFIVRSFYTKRER